MCFFAVLECNANNFDEAAEDPEPHNGSGAIATLLYGEQSTSAT